VAVRRSGSAGVIDRVTAPVLAASGASRSASTEVAPLVVEIHGVGDCRATVMRGVGSRRRVSAACERALLRFLPWANRGF
jgi:hypothetical protein